MPFRDLNRSRSNVELLMDISATLADYSQSLALARGIPGYLSRTLDLEPITLAIVQEAAGEAPAQVIFTATSQSKTAETLTLAPQDVQAIHEQTRARKPQEGPALSAEFNQSGATIAEMNVNNLGVFPRATVFARTVDDRHRMLLIVHQPTESHLTDITVGLLQLTADQLSKFMACIMAWVSRPQELGAPFQRLTEREWMVLRGLNSDAGEKQLADELGLSPHTLHSHIKSIYRKVGVQGRLPLLLRAEEAMRGLRLGRLNQRQITKVTPSNNLTVAVG